MLTVLNPATEQPIAELEHAGVGETDIKNVFISTEG
jgi:hypothetical protein